MDSLTCKTNGKLMSGGRYPVLRTIGILYLIGAAVTAIAGLVGIIYALGWGAETWGPRLALAGYILGGTFLGVISMLAVAEVIKLFIDIEHSCRSMAVTSTTVVAPVAPEAAVLEPTVVDGHRNRVMHYLDEETAEGALLRGH